MKTKDSIFLLRKYTPQPEALKLIPEAMARRYQAIPLEVSGKTLRIAMANTADIYAIEALETHTRKRIETIEVSREEITESIDSNYRSYEEIEKYISSITSPDSVSGPAPRVEIDGIANAPVARAISLIIEEAVKARASDIHFQPENDKLRIRYRVDGLLQDTITMPVESAATIVSRIKILANMNIADHHHPQDGQFTITTSTEQELDVRVGIIPTVHGEMVTMRLLDKSRAVMKLADLGFMPENLASYEKMLKNPHGMILISGPTGAGKSTTLYASVNSLDLKGRNIITIEDPVEYRFERINQIQVNSKAGLTFASGLRSILRHDPDVILVGEIRDSETAKIAIQAALTGHLVLSSIHANDAASIIFRLLDLGVEPFVVSTALVGVVAQRMVRRVCPDCSELSDIPLMEEMIYSKETSGVDYPSFEERRQFLTGTGCKSCGGTGYRGRVGIFEILTMSDKIRSMLLTEASTAEIRNQAVKEGMIPLLRDGMLKVKSGVTTPGEVLRNTYFVE